MCETMNIEQEIESRTLSYADLAKLLFSTKSIKSAFINYLDTELIIIPRDNFSQHTIDKIKDKLPIWLENIIYSQDPSVIYSSSCTRIDKIRIVEIVGSPLRLKLKYPGLEKLI